MEENEDAIVVKIGLFSGRPNPEMKLADQKASQFADLVKSAVGKEPIHPPPPSKLGEFHGYLVQVPEQKAKELGLPGQAIVFSGVLSDMTPKKEAYWRDVVGIEQFLTRLAYEEGFGDSLEKLGIAKPK